MFSSAPELLLAGLQSYSMHQVQSELSCCELHTESNQWYRRDTAAQHSDSVWVSPSPWPWCKGLDRWPHEKLSYNFLRFVAQKLKLQFIIIFTFSILEFVFKLTAQQQSATVRRQRRRRRRRWLNGEVIVNETENPFLMIASKVNDNMTNNYVYIFNCKQFIKLCSGIRVAFLVLPVAPALVPAI